VPALYALWFKVRRDETAQPVAEQPNALGSEVTPLPIAAE
jgi:hypothetical protein